MTLRDLITTGNRICEIDADIRDYSNGKGLLIDSFDIGIRACEDKALDVHHEPRWKTIKKPINYKDIGKDYWGIIENNIPKKLLDMEVHDWDLWDGWSTNNGLNKHMRLSVDLVGKDDCIVIDQTKPQGQLEGQMCIEDLIEKQCAIESES